MDQVAIPFSLIEAALNSAHSAELMGRSTATHDPACRLVGQLVRYCEDADYIGSIVAACLPANYGGNTLREIPGMVKGALDKGYADPTQAETGGRKQREEKTSSTALKLMSSVRLLHTPQQEAYASLRFPKGGRHNVLVRSDIFKRHLQLSFYRTQGKTIPKEAIGETIDLIEAKAFLDSPETDVHVRLAQSEDYIFYDLGNDDGSIVEIGSEGWKLVGEAPVEFTRPSGFQAQVVPARGGSLSELSRCLSLDKTNEVLLQAFLISAFNPDGPFPLLFIGGEHGSGKSFLSSMVKRILDPNALEKLRLPRDEHTLAIQAAQNRALVYDNTSYVRADISDSLCALATGMGFSTRKLYTDNETRTFKIARPVVINGIGDFADRPDLLDRAIQIKLTNLATSGVALRTERELNEIFYDVLPGVLGHLLDIVSYAQAHLAQARAPDGIRMADAARWLVAAEPATGHPTGTFTRALVAGLENMLVTKALNDPLVLALFDVLKLSSYQSRGFEGGFGDLHFHLKDGFGHIDRRLPATPAHLSNAIQRLKPAMATIGLMVELPRRGNRGQRLRLWQVPSEHRPTPVDDADASF